MSGDFRKRGHPSEVYPNFRKFFFLPRIFAFNSISLAFFYVSETQECPDFLFARVSKFSEFFIEWIMN